ncbi:hypothetical protein C8F01DRAFT_1373266 [Mycena amicta]|nr:hypothetical protein C8F01DRAFT_1373266 [Mycena amicta]
MHPLFAPYPNMRGIDENTRRASQEAIAGDSIAIKDVLSFTADERIPFAYKKMFMLPIIYANLDPARIPTGAELDELLDSYRNEEEEDDGDETWPWCFHTKIWMLLVTLNSLEGIPEPALVELWPRVFLWVQFLCEHLAVHGWIEASTIYPTFCNLLALFPRHAVVQTPGLRRLVAQAWASFFKKSESEDDYGEDEDPANDPVLRPETVKWFMQLCEFIDNESCGVNGWVTSGVSDEYAAGAVGVQLGQGGLAEKTLTGIAPGAWGLGNLVFKHIMLIPSRGGRLAAASPALSLAVKINPDAPFHRVIDNLGVLIPLSMNIDTMADEFERRFTRSAAEVFNQCAALWLRSAASPPSWGVLPRSVFGDFLSSLITISTAATAFPETANLIGRMLDQLSAYTVSYSLLVELKSSLPRAVQLVRASQIAAISEPWKRFVLVAKERLAFKKQYDSPQYISLLACDACGSIKGKDELKGCSRCHVRFYCGVACQTADWEAHKLLCKGIRSDKLGLMVDDRAFLRALVLDIYQRRKREILTLHLGARRELGTHEFYTRFDFSFAAANGRPDSVNIDCIAFQDVRADDPHVRKYNNGPRLPVDDTREAAWTAQKADYEARATADGRMHLVAVLLPHRDFPVILPLRYEDTAVSDRLEGIVAMSGAEEQRELDALMGMEARMAC